MVDCLGLGFNVCQFQIIDEKSLIKKYQKEISSLKEELDQLKRGMLVGVSHEDIIVLRQQVYLALVTSLLLCVFCSLALFLVE